MRFADFAGLRRKSPENAGKCRKTPGGKITRHFKAFSACQKQACPDTKFGIWEPGEYIGEEDTEEWLQEQAAFFTRKRKAVAKAKAHRAQAKAKGKAKAKAKEKPKPVGDRIGGFRLVRAFDDALFVLRNVGLSAFLPGAAGMDKPIQERPLLVLHMDEASSNYAFVFWLLYAVKLRVVAIRDVYHREWNDVKLAMQNAGVLFVLLILTSFVICSFVYQKPLLISSSFV